MLKVYRSYAYVSINGGDWREVGDGGYTITDEELSNVVVIDEASFDVTREFLKSNPCYGVYNSETYFTHKPTIKVAYTDAWDYVEYKGFKTLSYKQVYKEWKSVTMQWIMEHASADQFIQYLKERGITTCPMNF